MDRSCRRCGESLRVPDEGRVPARRDANVSLARRERSSSKRSLSVGFGLVGIVVAIMVLGVACAIIVVSVGD